MKIIVVEDDHLQSDTFISQLSSHFGDAQIQLIETESDFRQYLHELQADLPDIFLMDIMLRWANTSPNIPSAPDDVKEDGLYTAGLRCLQLLNKDAKTSHIPVILYSVLTKADIENKLYYQSDNVTYLPKDKDIMALINIMRKKVLKYK